jgi:hypothetical protein
MPYLIALVMNAQLAIKDATRLSNDRDVRSATALRGGLACLFLRPPGTYVK